MTKQSKKSLEDVGHVPATWAVCGQVQSYACLIAVAQDWTIVAASRNCSQILGLDAETILGQQFGAVFLEQTIHKLRSQAQVLSDKDPEVRVQGCEINDTGALADVTASLRGDHYCFEFEPAERAPGLSTDVEKVQRLIRYVARKNTLREAAVEAARVMRALSGFDRISLHEVHDGDLTVALGCAGGGPLTVDPGATLLRAHSGAPLDQVHLVSDLGAQTFDVLAQLPDKPEGAEANYENLSSSKITEALHSMLSKEEAQAAMVVPIRVKSSLWGAFVCHHSEPIAVSVGLRSALSLFALLLGYELERLSERQADLAHRHARDLRRDLMRALDVKPDLAAAVAAQAAAFKKVLSHDGLILWHRDQFFASGRAAEHAECEEVLNYLSRQAPDTLHVFEDLSGFDITFESFDAGATALMAIPISRSSRDYVLLFRDTGQNPQRASCWQGWEHQVAASLRDALVEAQLNLAETGNDRRQRDEEKQNLLIAELNHRVRNILNLIRGLLSQTRGDVGSVEEYASVLEARLHALARAHDQLTERAWSWVQMRMLLERQIAGALSSGASQIEVAGEDLDLSPTAFTAMALILHELITNSQKYGALSVPEGRVEVSLGTGSDGFGTIRWIESNGPPVEPPTHKGFGLIVIEQSVPYELRGRADLRFEPDGLQAIFDIPQVHVRRHAPGALDAAHGTAGQELRSNDIAIDGAAMILDDSLIISIDAGDLLKAAGATKIYSCNSVEAALTALDEGDVSFALVDVNLGPETSLAVAEQLWNDGIPSVLATGYGSNEIMLADFPPMPVLTKPYTLADIKEVLRKFRDAEIGDDS